MTNIYVVRHCEAMGNAKRVFQGMSDFDISDMGSKQLTCLSERFRNLPLDCVYTSPLLRAKKTALAIIGNRDIESIVDIGLREIDVGILEGKPISESFARHPALAEAWTNHPQDFAPQKGEPMREAYDRIWNTVCTIAVQNPGKTVACASHGGVIRCLTCRLLYGDIAFLKNTPWSENTSVMLLQFHDHQKLPRIVFSEDVSHLPNELLPKRSRILNLVGEKQL